MYPSFRTDAEHTIALARVVLACASLLAVWLDPAEPERYAQLTYILHVVYVTYAAGLAVFTRRHHTDERVALITHLVDIAIFSAFQFLSLGPSSPFFVYFVFSVFCAAIRWGWRATLWTGSLVVATFLFMTFWMARRIGPAEYDLNRAIIRTVYLIVCAGLLVYLGRHENRLREEIEHLARWPATAGLELRTGVERIVEYAAGIVEARRAVIVWEGADEPIVHVCAWSPHTGAQLMDHPPGSTDGIVPPLLKASTFLVPQFVTSGSPLLVKAQGADATREQSRFVLLPILESLQNPIGLASAPFRSERVAGRVFFADLETPRAELMSLTEVVAREIGTSLDQMHVTQRLTEIATGEERLRVARDLHDGVLQSLTGIRLEIRAVASALDGVADSGRDRLFAVERAIAIEQRELRMFIGDLGPPRRDPERTSLSGRLETLRERLALEWKVPVAIQVAPGVITVPEPLVEAVPMMVHEAVVNALKHAQPSRVSVTVDGGPDEIRVAVADDGRGFPFRGRFDHVELIGMRVGPRSLLERVSSLGGRMTIDSADTGSRVEMHLSL